MNEFYFVLLDFNVTIFRPGMLGYIDPGTGSIIIQAIVAAVVGLGIALKLFWHRILKFLGIRKTTKPNNNDFPKEAKQ